MTDSPTTYTLLSTSPTFLTSNYFSDRTNFSLLLPNSHPSAYFILLSIFSIESFPDSDQKACTSDQPPRLVLPQRPRDWQPKMPSKLEPGLPPARCLDHDADLNWLQPWDLPNLGVAEIDSLLLDVAQIE